MCLPGLAVNYQYSEAVTSKFAKGWLMSVFLHRYNNPIQMKSKTESSSVQP